MAGFIAPIIGSIIAGLGHSGILGGQQQQPVAPPGVAAGQQNWINQYQNALGQAQQPTFNAGNIASWMQQLNKGTAGSQNSFLNALAGAGGLNSGRAATGLSGIQQGRLGNIANFFGTLPMAEREQANQRTSQLLGAGSSFFAPHYGQTQTTTGQPAMGGALTSLGMLGQAGGFGVGPFSQQGLSSLTGLFGGGNPQTVLNNMASNQQGVAQSAFNAWANPTMNDLPTNTNWNGLFAGLNSFGQPTP